ncbi:MAG TPA: hypothetical protein DCW68_00485, partial [Rhodospirillaceae bacterium]|nr:hypothetical protein [Rhodospirillaceae bacterium]
TSSLSGSASGFAAASACTGRTIGQSYCDIANPGYCATYVACSNDAAYYVYNGFVCVIGNGCTGGWNGFTTPTVAEMQAILRSGYDLKRLISYSHPYKDIKDIPFYATYPASGPFGMSNAPALVYWDGRVASKVGGLDEMTEFISLRVSVIYP